MLPLAYLGWFSMVIPAPCSFPTVGLISHYLSGSCTLQWSWSAPCWGVGQDPCHLVGGVHPYPVVPRSAAVLPAFFLWHSSKVWPWSFCHLHGLSEGSLHQKPPWDTPEPLLVSVVSPRWASLFLDSLVFPVRKPPGMVFSWDRQVETRDPSCLGCLALACPGCRMTESVGCQAKAS